MALGMFLRKTLIVPVLILLVLLNLSAEEQGIYLAVPSAFITLGVTNLKSEILIAICYHLPGR